MLPAATFKEKKIKNRVLVRAKRAQVLYEKDCAQLRTAPGAWESFPENLTRGKSGE